MLKFKERFQGAFKDALKDALKPTAVKLEAARFGLIASACAVLIATVGTELTWRAMSVETQAFIEQSIGDTASLLASHVKTQIEHRIRRVREEGQRLRALNPQVNVEFATDPEILALSIWKRSVNADGSFGNPERVSFAANPAGQTSAPAGLVQTLQSQEASERVKLEPTWRGQISASLIGTQEGLLWVSLPESGGVEAVSAYLFVPSLTQAFKRENMVRGTLVDSLGQMFTQSSEADQPLVQALLGAEAQATPSAQLRYKDKTGEAHFGGYRRLGLGGLSVIARVSEVDARSGLESLRTRSIAFILLVFFVSFFSAYAYSVSRANNRPRREERADGDRDVTGAGRGTSSMKIAWTGEDHAPVPTEKTSATVFYGVFRKTGSWVDEKDPEVLRLSLNDFYTLVSSRAREFTPKHSPDAVFEAFQGGAFSVSWKGEVSHSALWAMSLAIQLRKDFQQLNESRKVDGLPEMHYGFGIHCGVGVFGEVGEPQRERPTLVTWVHQGARALENIAEISGHDGLVSRDVWSQVSASFLGSPIGEAKLCNETGLVEYYTLAGYRGEDQQEVWVETAYSKSEPVAGAVGVVEGSTATKRWLVNNGSQMVGPLTPEEIAGQLFSQELDFECECWSEGTGKSSQIDKAGIFGAVSDEKDDAAVFWVFDGKTMHGPMTKGLVMTALTRGALSIETSFVCEKSTVQGWVPGKAFIAPVAPTSVGPAEASHPNAETVVATENEKAVA